MAKTDLTAQRLRELLNYDPETGVFTNRVYRLGGRKAGAVVGCKRKDGRVVIRIDGYLYFAHRLAWLHVYGEWPTHEVDHKSCVQGENSQSNLRDVPHATNMQNERRPRRNNKAGILGVYWNKELEKWGAQITVNYRNHQLGFFETPEQASAAYVSAKRLHHPGCTL